MKTSINANELTKKKRKTLYLKWYVKNYEVSKEAQIQINGKDQISRIPNKSCGQQNGIICLRKTLCKKTH